MYCNQIFSLLALTEEETSTYTIQNVIVASDFEKASKIARVFYGNSAIALDTTRYPVGIGCTYREGIFYDREGNVVEKIPTEAEQIAALEELLVASDEAVVSLYEMQLMQDEVNVAQDEAITGLYEMMGGE